jgi:hypothetical protein
VPTPLAQVAGCRFGRAQAIEISHKTKGSVFWRCVCDCGNEFRTTASALRKGRVRSCGCLRSEAVAAKNTIHGLKRRGGEHPLYSVWRNMIERCENPKCEAYVWYGARGISVSKSWRRDFAAFLADVGDRPSKLHSLDRIDMNGNYEPGNIRWATSVEQSNNRRSTRLIQFGGRTMSLKQWADSVGVSARTLSNRLSRMPIEEAMKKTA